jgi:predicted DNA-binding transcriptional regulator YafY
LEVSPRTLARDLDFLRDEERDLASKKRRGLFGLVS